MSYWTEDPVERLEKKKDELVEKLEQPSSGNGELLYTEEDIKNAYRAGWTISSAWSGRPDLLSDIDSQAYLNDRKKVIDL